MHFTTGMLVFVITIAAIISTTAAGEYGIKPIDTKPPADCDCVDTYAWRFGLRGRAASEGRPTSTVPYQPVEDALTILSVKLIVGGLFDRHSRVGGIVANRQFQFDGPPSQAGTIYNRGWALCKKGYFLTLGATERFWQCKSGSFYNMYDQKIGDQCREVYLLAHRIHVNPDLYSYTGYDPRLANHIDWGY